MNEDNNTFAYTYSASQREEIQKIREKYIPPEENKLEQLKRLDTSAGRPGLIVGLIVGILGCLLLGVGMCCTMVWSEASFIPGVFIGIAGIAGMGIAYPLSNHITKKRREKIAPEILRLTEELSR